MKKKQKQLSFDQYYMEIAKAISKRANCLGEKVGAIIVLGNRIISSGYNGVPEGMTNCQDGGCRKCLEKNDKRKRYPKKKERRHGMGKGYEECICVHAEQNVLMTAARFGIAVDNGIIYTTLQPCFSCIKQMLQAKIRKVYFIKEWMPDRRLVEEYEKIQKEFPEGVWKLSVNEKCEEISRKFSLKIKK